jgi:predicted Zn-ribbon and HTH transcriptional regulator
MVSPGGPCPFCHNIDIVQDGYPEGSTGLTWSKCRACRKIWFHEIGSSDSCPECKGLKAHTFTADSVVITLRCTVCASEWLFRTTVVFERWLNNGLRQALPFGCGVSMSQTGAAPSKRPVKNKNVA